MPELPEVETVRRGLAPFVVGRRIEKLQVLVPALRGPLDRAQLRRRLQGKTIVSAGRRGKYLLFGLDDGSGFILHLGMSGSCWMAAVGQALRPHDHLVLELSGGLSWRYNDPRRFGCLQLCDSLESADLPAALREMGPEPLEGEFTADYLFKASRGSARPVKTFLLDQAVVAGIGNIYASETLWRAKVHPEQLAGSLTRRQCAALVDHARAVLAEAVAAGGTTISDHRQPDGSEGGFSVNLAVYDRAGEPCQRCGKPVLRLVQSGRSTFFCPKCQPSRPRRS
jgi:formamidopyrimidine-DNA glycosylase